MGTGIMSSICLQFYGLYSYFRRYDYLAESNWGLPGVFISEKHCNEHTMLMFVFICG